MTSLNSRDRDLHNEDGTHRTTPPSADGHAVTLWHARLTRHMEAHGPATNVTATDIMDADEVAAAFGVKASSLYVAMSNPATFPSLAARLPSPLRRVGRSWVWARTDIEAALKETS